MTKHTDTPPVAGEIPEAVVADVAAALEAEFLRRHRSYGGWMHEARAAIAAYLPHLTAEIEQLRAGYASCEYLLPLGHEDAQTCDQPCHPSTDRCPQHDPRHLDYIAGLRSEIASLKDAHEGRDVNDRGRDAETTALRAENEKLAELWHEVVDTPRDGEAQIWLRRWMTSGWSIAEDRAEFDDVQFVRADEVHEVIRAYLVANGLPVPALVSSSEDTPARVWQKGDPEPDESVRALAQPEGAHWPYIVRAAQGGWFLSSTANPNTTGKGRSWVWALSRAVGPLTEVVATPAAEVPSG